MLQQLVYLLGVFVFAGIVLIFGKTNRVIYIKGLNYVLKEHKLPGDKKSKKRAKKN